MIVKGKRKMVKMTQTATWIQQLWLTLKPIFAHNLAYLCVLLYHEVNLVTHMLRSKRKKYTKKIEHKKDRKKKVLASYKLNE